MHSMCSIGKIATLSARFVVLFDIRSLVSQACTVSIVLHKPKHDDITRMVLIGLRELHDILDVVCGRVIS